MQISVTGRHVEITDSLKNFTEEKMARLERHFDHVSNIHVVLSVEKLRHTAEASFHISGSDIFADSTQEDMYSAIDTLVDKLDRQLIKHKEKMTDHHRGAPSLKNLHMDEA